MKKIVIIFSVLLSACAAKYSGTVDKDARNYDSMEESAKVKLVSYNCNYNVIANESFKKFGDYCPKSSRADYVSYFIPADVQSTSGFKEYLIQTTSDMNENCTDYRKYFIIYSDNSFKKLLNREINSTPPSSFAVKINEKSYALVITREDLLARITISPSLAILSLEKTDNSQEEFIKNYKVTYKIAPYVFTVNYDDEEMGRLLGLPDYKSFNNPLSSEDKKILKEYNTSLKEFWRNLEGKKYSLKEVSVMDYALPQLGKAKFKSDKSKKLLRPSLPADGFLLNDYLPSYELHSIKVVHLLEDKRLVVKDFSQKDIYNVAISLDNEALAYKGEMADEVRLVYTYKAKNPKGKGLNISLSEKLGLGYIYSDMGDTITVNINVKEFYELSELPAGCVDMGMVKKELESKGFGREDIINIFNNLKYEASYRCTGNMESIGRHLSKIF